MQFYFSYPLSETQSYYLLQDCLVALFYQLYFLRLQCESGYTQGYGWGWCKYGEGVKCDDCKSWICPVGNKGKHEKEKDKCGKDEKSPLQAFLCDCLKEFTCPVLVEGTSGKEKKYQDNLQKLREKTKSGQHVDYQKCYPEFLEHRKHPTVPGSECSIPMGFTGCFREKKGSDTPGTKDGMIGVGIYAAVSHYASTDIATSSLYQITRCICSLTRRVPRSTGTLYGFFQGIISVYGGQATSQQKDAFKNALDKELAKETFGLGRGSSGGGSGTSGLMDVVMGWKTKTGDHKSGDKCESLDSLSGCEEGSKAKSDTSTCGKYLHPLTGSLYNSVATVYTDTYLSWIIHLTGVLQSGLRALLDEFTRISCKDCKQYRDGKLSSEKSGCSGTCRAPEDGQPGQHGTETGSCSCDNLVICAGVYGVFYRFGFSIHSPSALTGKDQKNGGQDAIRKCDHFYKQLQTVITGDLFTDLLTQIRAFLYSTRLPFTLVIFCFWSIVLVYLLWSITGPLDLLHIQSHWRSPGSYLVPLQRILADGSRKGFCTLGYFQDSGDRLLSQGVSDVYM